LQKDRVAHDRDVEHCPPTEDSADGDARRRALFHVVHSHITHSADHNDDTKHHENDVDDCDRSVGHRHAGS
jgi:hypothetical protein